MKCSSSGRASGLDSGCLCSSKSHLATRPERRKPAVRNLHDSEDKPMSKTTVVEKWVDEAAALAGPSKVTWADGSKQEYDRLVEEMLGDGTLLELNQKTYPGCFLHRSHPQDVARTEQLTFICSREADDAGPTNNWMAPAEAKAKAAGYFVASMHIMTRVGQVAIDHMRADDDFIAGLHGMGDLSPERRLILHFPEEKLIWSVGSGYGG